MNEPTSSKNLHILEPPYTMTHDNDHLSIIDFNTKVVSQDGQNFKSSLRPKKLIKATNVLVNFFFEFDECIS